MSERMAYRIKEVRHMLGGIARSTVGAVAQEAEKAPWQANYPNGRRQGRTLRRRTSRPLTSIEIIEENDVIRDVPTHEPTGRQFPAGEW